MLLCFGYWTVQGVSLPHGQPMLRFRRTRYVQVPLVAGAASISGGLPSVMWQKMRCRLSISAMALVSLLHSAHGDFSYVQVANQDNLQHGDVSLPTLHKSCGRAALLKFVKSGSFELLL